MEESSSPLLQNQEGTALADRNESIRQRNGKPVKAKYKILINKNGNFQELCKY